MSRDDLLGAYVVAENARGGKWRGRCVTFTLEGLALVECAEIDIGYGWRELPRMERKAFSVERVEAIETD